MKIKVENTYSDGHESTQYHEIDDAIVADEQHCPVNGTHAWVETPLGWVREGDQWVRNPETFTYCQHCDTAQGEVLQDFLYTYTGDGTGENMDAYYEVTVLDGAYAGQTFEWG